MLKELKETATRLLFVLFVVKIIALLIAKGFLMVNIEKLLEKFNENNNKL